jgi:hypothetical protein
MKRIIVCFLAVIIFGSCSTPMFYKTDFIPLNNITLMPYKNKSGLYGYVNSETFEIVIPAQYKYANSFVNGFALVAKEWETYEKTKYFLINQKNEVVIKNLDYAHIIEAENHKTVFALAINHSGLEFHETTAGGLFSSIKMLYDSPSHTTYRLYNLNTGKLVWEKRVPYNFSNHPKIYFFADYMTFEEDIYQIRNDGIFVKKDIGAKEFRKLVAEILKEKKLENVFYNWKYSYDDLYNEKLDFNLLAYNFYFSIESFDFDLLIHNLPEKFRLHNFDTWEKGDNWVDYVRAWWKPVNGKIHSRPVNIDEFHPFLEKTWLFEIPLYTENWEQYVGLYNASENQWAIPPIKRQTFSKFKMTGYDGLICYTPDQTGYSYFYNIKTREKFKYLYEYDNYRKTMAYMGYYEDENKIIIEKF